MHEGMIKSSCKILEHIFMYKNLKYKDIHEFLHFMADYKKNILEKPNILVYHIKFLDVLAFTHNLMHEKCH